jgi:hypothetical protein
MSSLSRTLLVPAIALGLSAPAFAQPRADAGSGPTSGAISTNDAGSGPTKGAKPNTGSTASTASSSENSDATPGPKSTGGAQPVTPGMSESSSQQMRTDRDRPPGDAQTSDKRGERAMTPTPMSESQAQSTAGSNLDKKQERLHSIARGAAQRAAEDAARQKSDNPTMGESQKPYGKVGP